MKIKIFSLILTLILYILMAPSIYLSAKDPLQKATPYSGLTEIVVPPENTGQKAEPAQSLPAPDTSDSSLENAPETEDQELSTASGHNAASVAIEGQTPELKAFWDSHRDILPWDYAYVEDIPTPVFREPLESIENARPVQVLDGGPGTFRWVSLEVPDIIEKGTLKWYNINPDQYVEARHLKKFWASDFHGIDLKKHPLDGRYGWIVFDVYTSSKPGKEEFFDGMLLKKHALVKLYETVHINGWDWHRVGENQWVEQRRVAQILNTPRPDTIPPGVKWIDINLYEQTIAAHDGDQMIYVSLVSSGLPDFDTPAGLYRIWAKVKFAKMSGGEKDKNFYFLEDVPYHMYFFNGYAIHGAYWHNNFGVKQSHGCVNLSCLDAAWFFEWTLPKAEGDNWKVDKKARDATYVWIHN